MQISFYYYCLYSSLFNRFIKSSVRRRRAEESYGGAAINTTLIRMEHPQKLPAR